ASSELEDLCCHINTRILNIKKTLQLRNIGQDPSLQDTLGKIRHEMVSLHGLMDKMETELKEREKLKNSLQELRKSAERDQLEAQHLRENIPPHLPQPTQSCFFTAWLQEPRSFLITFCCLTGNIPNPRIPKRDPDPVGFRFPHSSRYMKGRLTYEQINAVVQELNKAVVSKYKILHQPLKSMSVPVRNLYHRFQEEETKDTKGIFY
ncbi:SKA1 protein, partial [Todus mexicanus]|nr:SKA1 protein [Todus mexicanus]